MKTKTPILMLGIGLTVGILVGYSLKDSTSQLPQQISADAFVLKDYVAAWNANPTAIEAAANMSDDEFLSYFPKDAVRLKGKSVIRLPKKDLPQLDALDSLEVPYKGPKLDLIDMRYDAPQLD